MTTTRPRPVRLPTGHLVRTGSTRRFLVVAFRHGAVEILYRTDDEGRAKARLTKAGGLVRLTDGTRTAYLVDTDDGTHYDPSCRRWFGAATPFAGRQET